MQSTNAPLLHDAALVAELQTRLKVPRSTDVPKAEHVELALRLAREPATDTTKGFWPASIKSSDTRTRIKKLAKRMDEEGHLAAAERAILAQPNGALPPASNFGLGDLYDGLLVPLEWVSENASRLTLLPTQPLTLSPCGKFATRQIIALKDSCCEQVGELVRYDLPPASGEDADAAKLRRDAHRLREKAVIRALDGAAADEYRTKRTQQRRDERSEGYDIAHAVAAVLETLLSAVERKVRRDLWWWRCPAGCPQGATDCARVAFRDKCLELERGRGQLTADHDAEDFLATWDGVSFPWHWTPNTKPLVHGDEYLGLGKATPDQYSERSYEVGRHACARRGCEGCCYCRNQPQEPVRLQVREFKPGYQMGSTCAHRMMWSWLTVDGLRDKIQRMATERLLVQRSRCQPICCHTNLTRMICSKMDVSSAFPAACVLTFRLPSLTLGISNLRLPASFCKCCARMRLSASRRRTSRRASTRISTRMRRGLMHVRRNGARWLDLTLSPTLSGIEAVGNVFTSRGSTHRCKLATCSTTHRPTLVRTTGPS